jgi:predicted nucleotidyltransferase
MSMDQSKIIDLEKLRRLSRQDPEVLAVLLFGSVARGEQTAGSDLDVCLVLIPQRTLHESVTLARKRLDYLTHVDLDVQIFQALPLYIRTRILKEGQVLFVRNEDLLYEVAFRTAQAFEDFKPIYDRYLEEVAHARP